ncbi:AAA family ATPase [Halococcoides cellulosivorans]|uniref:ATPase n=1 Tax=Halococcoides cellulosivorans TaxID=1679096 RepID=A0A2R4X403_9EURY|nr:AAA family ATPase [Halococcoides cellulosivorans]AWB28519.1 ATPase [Halococcoides cellulosivorans]
MQLERIELENFRQFRSESIEFANDADKNVTVVHGSNGSGKTTILNAFTWLFYDEVDFDTRPERLASEGAMAGAESGNRVQVSVRLSFEHDGTEYVAERVAVYEKRTPDDFDGEIVEMDLRVKYRENGSWNERNNPSNTLDQVLPERLSGLFFFDGEDIDELAGIDNQGRIQEAIQNIMGLTILERATHHLDEAAGRFEDETQDSASEELTDLISKKQGVEEEIETLERDRDDTKRNKDRIEQEIDDIDQKLERLDESAALQERRSEYQGEIDELEHEIEDINEQIRSKLSDEGVVPMAMPLIKETAEQIDGMRERGEIPSELSNSFIESLLAAEQCICGRPLNQGTDSYERVVGRRGEVIEDGVEQGALRIVGQLNRIVDIEATFFDEIEELTADRQDLHDEIGKFEEKIDEVSAELQEMDATTEEGLSVKDLENKRKEKLGTRDDLIGEKATYEKQIEEKQDRVDELEDEIDDQEDEHEETLLAKRRRKAAKEIERELQTVFDELKDKVRRWSNERIQSEFSQIASKDLEAEISEDFELKIWQDVGGERIEVDKSRGERQIASLAFIGSLVDIARERYESNNDAEYFDTGGIYPIVMDSPFGALDKSHTREVSRAIPNLANQVVVFATDAQWDGPVSEEMDSVVGDRYSLNFTDGDGKHNYPQTTIETGRLPVGDE